jgi:uncharacterized GH25 family protein
MAAANVQETTAQMAQEATRQFEDSSARVKEFSANIVGNSKASGRLVVDNYEKAAKSVFELQRQLAGNTQVEWVKDAAHTQIQFAEDITSAWTRAARQLLK